MHHLKRQGKVDDQTQLHCNLWHATRHPENSGELRIQYHTINTIVQAKPKIAIMITKCMEDIIIL